MRIGVVTDSTADLPKGYYQEYGIRMVPLTVHFGEETYKDGVDLTSEEFYAKLAASDVMPRTSQPSPADFAAVYEELARDFDAVISVHLSGKASGTLGAARLAASMVSPSLKVEVFDGRSFSTGTGLMALEAAKMARDGRSLPEIIERLTYIRDNLQVFFTVDTLEYLHKNGRIGKATAFLGSVLNIRPILKVEDGEIAPAEKVRGKSKILPKVIELMHERVPQGAPIRVAFIHSGQPELMKQWVDAITSEFVCVEPVFSMVGPVIGTHAGPGTIGLAFYPELS